MPSPLRRRAGGRPDWRGPAAVLAAGLALALTAPAARAQDQAAIDLGMRLYKGAGGCATCHAWTGRGAMQFEPGAGFLDSPPSLVDSRLTRAEIVTLLACGTPGGKMPQYLAEAWTDRYRCNGQRAADLAAEDRPPRAYSVLSRAQIEALATYVTEVYQGHGMSDAHCAQYHGPPARACSLLR